MKKGLLIRKGGKRFLNGQPFIVAEVATEEPRFPLEGLTTPSTGTILRTCENCFFRGEMTPLGSSGKGDCHCGAIGNLAKLLFGIGGSIMPMKIDNQPVGNYCPHWLPFWAE
jgi:hypothetical protein